MAKKRLLAHKRFGKLMGLVRRLQRPRNGLTRKVNKLIKAYQLRDTDCILCGSSEFQLVAETDRFGFDLKKKACKSCGLLQSNPLPQQEFFNTFYRDYYRKLYRGGRAEHLPKLFAQQNERGARIFDFLRQKCQINEFDIFEIGCSYGGVLDAFRQRGLFVAGCDLDEDAVAHAQSIGIDANVGALPSKVAARPTVYIMSHVLEHIPNPRETLSVLSSIMTADDLLYVEVPGLNALLKGAYRGDLLNYFHIGHVADFSASTLQSLMSTSGFRHLYIDDDVVSLFWRSDDVDDAPIANSFIETINSLRQIEANWTRIP